MNLTHRITLTLLLTLLIPPVAAICTTPAAERAIPAISLTLVAEGVHQPVAISHAGDGSGRLFVAEQSGRIRIITAGEELDPQPLLDLRDRVVSGGERGLLGLAFHPGFAQNRRFFVHYTAEIDGRLYNRISQFNLAGDGYADAASEEILLAIHQPYSNHNGGQIAFGADGYLYIAIGDGGSANDPLNAGQRLDTLLGKILRIDIDRRTPPLAYAIPADNPLANRNDQRGEIWAWGLRNPWRFSFDRLTGQLWAADVGQNAVEEINIIQRGGNYGWRVMEGNICTPGVNPNCDPAPYQAPIHTYRHDKGRSITGGYVYRGHAIPGLCGSYIFGDFVSQAIWAIRHDGKSVVQSRTLFDPRALWRLPFDWLRDQELLVSTFGEDEAGEILVASYTQGRIYRLSAAESTSKAKHP
jgi:glucose/arabinose dehydrogenase